MSFQSARTALVHGLVLLVLIDCRSATGPAVPDATHPQARSRRTLTLGTSLLVSSVSGSVWKLDAATLKILASGAPGGRLQDVAVSKNESEIYIASEDGWVEILDGGTLQRIARITLDGMAPFGLALTPDDAQLYVTSAQSGQLAIIDRTTRTAVQVIRVSGSPRRVAFSTTGSVAVVANESNWVDVVR